MDLANANVSSLDDEPAAGTNKAPDALRNQDWRSQLTESLAWPKKQEKGAVDCVYCTWSINAHAKIDYPTKSLEAKTWGVTAEAIWRAITDILSALFHLRSAEMIQRHFSFNPYIYKIFSFLQFISNFAFN